MGSTTAALCSTSPRTRSSSADPQRRTARTMAGRPFRLEAVASPLDEVDVDGLGSLLAGLSLVGDLGALGERAIPIGVDRRVVDEEVLAGLVGRDEPKALLIAEP